MVKEKVRICKQSALLSFSLKQIKSMEQEASRLGFNSLSNYLISLHNKALGIKHKKFSPDDSESESLPNLVFTTKFGKMYQGDSARFMKEFIKDDSIDLIMTSPPFGLVRKKVYGNEDADSYLAWFEQFASQFLRILKPSGSLVIDIGGAWKRGQPTRSLYHFELMIMLCRKFGFHLAQEFYWWNPAKLPTPAEWVNIRRVRVKDAINCVWWLSKTPYPKASNRRILQPYSNSMRELLLSGYKPKLRPSGHDISDKFQRDNRGAIPPNLIALANTESNSQYQRYCRQHKLPEHPARFPSGLPGFFIRMLTSKGDVVLDPFAGSGVTGAVCEKLGRRWECCELDNRYVEGAKGRFMDRLEDILSGGRTVPYEIHPPIILTPEEDIPLVEDGGASRPK